jgi:hypothetical protein
MILKSSKSINTCTAIKLGVPMDLFPAKYSASSWRPRSWSKFLIDMFDVASVWSKITSRRGWLTTQYQSKKIILILFNRISNLTCIWRQINRIERFNFLVLIKCQHFCSWPSSVACKMQTLTENRITKHNTIFIYLNIWQIDWCQFSAITCNKRYSSGCDLSTFW